MISTPRAFRGWVAMLGACAVLASSAVRAAAQATGTVSGTVVDNTGQLDLGSLRLDVGTVTEVVSVVAEGATIETKNSDYSGLLTSTQISHRA